jgi:hypothetical protein
MIPIIKIGTGFGFIKFGSKMEDVSKCLGEPEEEFSSGESPNNIIAWHYWTRDYSIYFDESEKYVFSSISIEDQNATLYGKTIFSLDINSIKDLFLDNGFNDFYEEKGDDGSIDLTVFDAACIAFYNKNGKLRSFDWFTFTDDDTNETIWPK